MGSRRAQRGAKRRTTPTRRGSPEGGEGLVPLLENEKKSQRAKKALFEPPVLYHRLIALSWGIARWKARKKRGVVEHKRDFCIMGPRKSFGKSHSDASNLFRFRDTDGFKKVKPPRIMKIPDCPNPVGLANTKDSNSTNNTTISYIYSQPDPG
jgi:hypothetical protein